MEIESVHFLMKIKITIVYLSLELTIVLREINEPKIEMMFEIIITSKLGLYDMMIMNGLLMRIK